MREGIVGVVRGMGVMLTAWSAAVAAQGEEPIAPEALLNRIDAARARLTPYTFTMHRKVSVEDEELGTRVLLTGRSTVCSDGEYLYSDEHGLLENANPGEEPNFRILQLSCPSWSKRLTVEPSQDIRNGFVDPPTSASPFRVYSPIAAMFETVHEFRAWFNAGNAQVLRLDRRLLELTAHDPSRKGRTVRVVVDESKGYLPVRAEVWQIGWRLQRLDECSAFHTSDNVVWFPKHVRRTTRLLDGPKNLTEGVVTAFSLDRAPKGGAHMLTFPPGLTVRDRVADMSYRVDRPRHGLLGSALGNFWDAKLPPELGAQTGAHGYLPEVANANLGVYSVGPIDAEVVYAPLVMGTLSPAAILLLMGCAWRHRRRMKARRQPIPRRIHT